ncbi:MAG: cytochrome c biogenesis protein CcsA [Bacteroidota bacterium]
MERFAKALFSMRMMALGMIVFLVSIGAATLIESTYGIQAAKIIIYNSLWFEILLAFLAINLISNIVRYKMFQREKMAMLTFHISFIIIIIGAGITRFISFEGLMLIREGESSNRIFLSDPHLWVRVNDGKMQYTFNEKKFMSEITDNSFDVSFDFPKHKSPIKIEYVDFKAKQIDTLLIKDSINNHVLDIVTDGKKSNFLSPNGFINIGDIPLSYEKKNSAPGIDIMAVNGKLMFKTKLTMQYLPMTEMKKVRESGMAISDSMYKKIPTDSFVPFLERTLYIVNGQQFVFNRRIDHARMVKMSSGRKDVGMDILTLRVSDGKESKIVALEGGLGQIPSTEVFLLNGLQYEMEYGSTQKTLPFAIACRDFVLDKYPGSDVASSFASELTILDKKKNYQKDKRVFMNNVMDYGGYRFFQSSYDLDNPQTPENEEGTRLSVNYDFWGTNVTYLGYLLMAIGMILSLFAPVGRFKELLGKIKKSRERRESSLLSLLVIFSFLSFSSFSQTAVDTNVAHNHEDHTGHNHEAEHSTTADRQVVTAPKNPIYRVMSEEHSDEFASLLIQDFKGRIVPAHTVCDELLRKIYGKNKFEKYNAVQTIVSMHMYPDYWVRQDVISVPKATRERLKLKEYASLMSLVDETGNFKFLDQYNEAHRKLESKRSEFEKKLIKLVERFEVVNSIVSWQYMKIIPVKNDPNNMWYVPLNMELMQKDSLSSSSALAYLTALDEASEKNSYGLALDKLNAFKKFQRETAGKVAPSESLVALEISYNKMDIYKNAQNSYILLGLILLIIFFIRIFVKPSIRSEKRFKRISTPFVVLLLIIFLYHAYGLSLRWYISGHAPWSNGYEALIFISWIAVLIGFIFGRKYPVVLALAAILAYFMLFVAHLEMLDPEITPLAPVLKSFWLKIHVAIITGSYAFLGVGAILGLLNLTLYNFRFKNNGQRLTANINEISAISELIITLGLFMLTIGTFLGGIWANESWGRYWGWDPKETWALVSVLVYAVILHFRYIPALSGRFTYNMMSLWGYTAILFTFFGVNFYLTGLHSYAQGDALAKVPDWLYYYLTAFYLFTQLSSTHYNLYKNEYKLNFISYFGKRFAVQLLILIVVFLFHLIFLPSSIDFSVIQNYLYVVVLITCTILFFALYSFVRIKFYNKNLKENELI